ncbi:MAG: cation:proton antiporter, partial [Deltaproteobacteria bacterium]|nr:cation:proton antiporter [Deltaproteobacteria bacterium]
MEIALLYDIVIIFGLSVVILFICHRLKVPAIVGFLLTGILAGPYGLGLVKAVHEVEVLAEVGVVLLLFTIGMEFSLEKLLKIKKSIL